MTQQAEIIRLAAKGDGVTSDGAHFGGCVPGDRIDSDGAIIHGPNHVDPPCPHFDTCGGCQLQYASDAVLRAFIRDRVANAAAGQGLVPGELLEEHLSPPRSRRRATLHAMRAVSGGKSPGKSPGNLRGKSKGKSRNKPSVKSSAVLGFRQTGSHQIVDITDCTILRPELGKLAGPLRQFVAAYGPKGAVDVTLSLCDQGVDLGLTNFPLEGLEATEAALDFARTHALARMTIDQGYGAEAVWEPEPVTITLSGVAVPMPSGAFLQATEDANSCMLRDTAQWLGDAPLVADLFSGLGTFAFAMAAHGSAGAAPGRKVLAAEAEQAAHLACKAAAAHSGGRVHAVHRDLFRNPLQPDELNRFDAVLLDPPRAGAKAQIEQIAACTAPRVVYVSCNPSSWARDAAVLVEGGYELKKLRPVGQFRWSTHVELVSLFERKAQS